MKWRADHVLLAGLCAAMSLSSVAAAQDIAKVKGSVSLNLLLPGKVYREAAGEDLDSDFGPMVRAEIGVGPENVSFGLYSNLVLAAIDGKDCVWAEIGLALSYPMNLPDGKILKPSLQIGFRTITHENDVSTGLAVDLNVQYQFPLQDRTLIADFGVIGQPAGEDENGDAVEFAPIFYMGIGAAF